VLSGVQEAGVVVVAVVDVDMNMTSAGGIGASRSLASPSGTQHRGSLRRTRGLAATAARRIEQAEGALCRLRSHAGTAQMSRLGAFRLRNGPPEVPVVREDAAVGRLRTPPWLSTALGALRAVAAAREDRPAADLDRQADVAGDVGLVALM
jgi:hypothetical protein